jgi:hypothetical protein
MNSDDETWQMWHFPQPVLMTLTLETLNELFSQYFSPLCSGNSFPVPPAANHMAQPMLSSSTVFSGNNRWEMTSSLFSA